MLPLTQPPLSPDLIPGLAALFAYALGLALRGYARSDAWTEASKRAIPRLAVIAGAAMGYAVGALINGGGWRDVALGALGGAGAVAFHESTRGTRTGRGEP